MNPEELLRQATAAIRQGADPAAVNQRIAQLTGGQFTDTQALARAIQQTPREQTPEEAAQARLAERGGSALSDFLRMAAQGATFGFADELAGLGAALVPGGRGYREAVEESRQRVEDLRLLAPGASAAAEIAGGVAVPFAGAARLTRSLVRPGAGLLGRAAAGAGAGAATGAAAGAATGFGEAEGDIGERLPAAGRGAAAGGGVGGLLGGVLPVVGAGAGRALRFGDEVLFPQSAGTREARRAVQAAFEEAGIAPEDVRRGMAALGPEAVIADLDPALARRARAAVNLAPSLERVGGPVQRLAERTEARGERLARAMREASGITETMESGKALAERAVEDVRARYYRPLEQAFPEVTGPNITEALRDPRIAQVARRTARDLDERPPSFTELQDIMGNLRDRFMAARKARKPHMYHKALDDYNKLVSAMEQDIPGFREAQDAFMRAARTVQAFGAGAKAWTKSAREIREAMAELPPEAHDAFRTGLLQRWEESLLSKEGTSGAVNSILKAGPEIREQIRIVFGSDEAFQDFLRTRGLERQFRLTEAAVQGNSTTAKQVLDTLDPPRSREQLFARVWDALFSPGEARRVREQAVGEALLGRDIDAVLRMLRPNFFGVGVPGVGGGLAGATGAAVGGIFQ